MRLARLSARERRLSNLEMGRAQLAEQKLQARQCLVGDLAGDEALFLARGL